MGGGWQGGGWQGGGWQGGGWQGGGWSGGGGVATFAMRTDRPFADFLIASNLGLTFPDFPARYWDPDLWALTVLPEFFSLPDGGGGVAWAAINIPAPAAITQVDIDRLIGLAVTERPEALGEIIQQDQNLQLSWMQLLMMDASTHPCTFLLMKLAARVGETLMMHFKRKFNRPRPSQVCPTLFPPVAVPNHGSYPAGHALIGQLTSLCLAPLVPSRGPALFELARRAAFNREIAGLHYQSDCDAGVALANQIHPILSQCATYIRVINAIAARNEWANQ
jgi:hypothetical protein